VHIIGQSGINASVLTMEPNHATGGAIRLDDYRWLVSDEARVWISQAADSAATPLRAAAGLREHLSPTRVHLVLQQMELRQRALRSGKFPAADRMFFVPKLLQQATSYNVASYKASRFAGPGRVADLCCGIGGDLLALAERCSVLGVDRDPVAALLADANCLALARTRAEVARGDASEFPVGDFAAWHIDPDRRSAGRRTTRPEFYEPGLDCIEHLLSQMGTAAIKLAPAAEVPEPWARTAELEWIGEDRECKQQVAWFGQLARHPGSRAATILDAAGPQPATVVGQPDDGAVLRAEAVGGYVYEPHAAVLAARLVHVLAQRHRLKSISPDCGYLTGDAPIVEPAVAAFQVAEVLPLDVKRVRAVLRRLGVGRLDIKKRGIDVEPQRLRPQLHVPGNRHGTLLLTRFRGRSVAIVAKTVDSGDSG
jgi:hypothetical protein